MSVPLLLCLGLVVGVTDGDTLKIRCEQPNLGEIKVRFDEIDAPEKGQAFGNKAKQVLSDLAFEKTVRVLRTDTDKYGRTTARVELDYSGLELNFEMVRQGYAWCYTKYLVRVDACQALEANARRARLGLWADANPEPPSDWRHARKIGWPDKRRE